MAFLATHRNPFPRLRFGLLWTAPPAQRRNIKTYASGYNRR